MDMVDRIFVHWNQIVCRKMARIRLLTVSDVNGLLSNCVLSDLVKAARKIKPGSISKKVSSAGNATFTLSKH
jgi:hypothetical protein